MKATLEFTLPEDQADFTVAAQAQDWVLAMWDMDQWLRGRLKWPSDDVPDGYLKALEDARDTLHEILADRNLDLEVLP